VRARKKQFFCNNCKEIRTGVRRKGTCGRCYERSWRELPHYKEYRARPDVRKRRAEYIRKYSQTPKAKSYAKRKIELGRGYDRKRRQNPERREYMKKYFQEYRKRPQAILRKRELEHQYRRRPDIMLKRYLYLEREREPRNKRRRLQLKAAKMHHDIDQASKLFSATKNGDPTAVAELSQSQKYHLSYNRRPEVRERKQKYDREYRQRPEVKARMRKYDYYHGPGYGKSPRRVEYLKKYRQINRKRRNETYNKWRAKNRDRLNALRRERRAKRKAMVLPYQ
jgi:hypothetical protein